MGLLDTARGNGLPELGESQLSAGSGHVDGRESGFFLHAKPTIVTLR